MTFPFPVFCPAVAASGGGAPLDGLSNITGAWSMGRALLTAYGGAFYTDAGGGAISALLDQSGAARNLTQATSGARPLAITAGGSNRACARFDGGNDFLAGAALSNFITASAGYIIASFIPRGIATNFSFGWENDPVFHDGDGNLSMGLRSAPSAYSSNYDGSDDQTTPIAISIDGKVVMEWRRESGTLYCRIDGGTEQSVASGDTETLTNALVLCRSTSNVNYSQLDFFEGAIFSAVPSSGARDALVTALSNWIG